MLESKFKKQFKQKITALIPNVQIFEPNSTRRRSVPDMLLLNEKGWAALEFKRSKNAAHQPNQDERVEKLNKMGYARIIYPENEMEVLRDLEKLFSP